MRLPAWLRRQPKYRRNHPPRIHDFRDHALRWGHTVYYPKESLNRYGQRQMDLVVIGTVAVGDYLLLGKGPGGHWLIIENAVSNRDFNNVIAVREDPAAPDA